MMSAGSPRPVSNRAKASKGEVVSTPPKSQITASIIFANTHRRGNVTHRFLFSPRTIAGEQHETRDLGSHPGCGRGAGDAGFRAGGDLQPRLLRAVLSERQLPEQGTGQSVYRSPLPFRLDQWLC